MAEGDVRRPTRREARRTERFHQIPIFSNLNGKEVAQILRISDEVTVAAGEDVFAPGHPADGFYIITEGRITIRIRKKAGDEPTEIATLSDRSVFGEMSFLGKRPRSGFATAATETRLTKLDGIQFQALIDQGDLAAYKVIHNIALLIASRLRTVEDELLSVLEELEPETRKVKLKELQQFRNKLFEEWSF